MTDLVVSDPLEMHALGRRLGRAAGPGTVLALTGDLGAGKTALVQGVASGLGVDGAVPSPTFVLLCRYDAGRMTLWHADLYRLEDDAALAQLGLEEALDSGGVVAIEWPDRFPDVLPADHLAVRIDHLPQGRRVSLHATGPRHHAMLERLDG